MKKTALTAAAAVLAAALLLCSCSKKEKEPEKPVVSAPILSDEDLFPGVDTSPAPSVPDEPEPSDEPSPEPSAEPAPVDAPVERVEHTEQFAAEDGCVVLEVSISVPRLAGEDGAYSDINNYYDTQLSKQLIAAKEELLPRALEAYSMSLSSHTPFMPYYSTQDYEVTLNGKGYFSAVRTVSVFDGGLDLTLWAETFSLSDGGRLTLDDVFSAPESVYLEVLMWEVCDGMAAEPGRYHSDSSVIFSRAFQKDDFYLTGDSLGLFFGPGAVSSAVNGPEHFTVNITAIKEIFRLW